MEASRVVLVQVRMLLLRVPAFILRNLEVRTWYLSQAFLRFHAVSALFAGKLERNINLQTTVTKTQEHQNTTDTTLEQPQPPQYSPNHQDLYHYIVEHTFFYNPIYLVREILWVVGEIILVLSKYWPFFNVFQFWP